MSYPSISAITLKEYQDRLKAIASRFDVYGTEHALPTYALGLSGEVGEVAELLKRYFREGIEPDLEALEKELGDVVAYVCLLGIYFEIDLESILLANITKLEKRQENGTLQGSGSDR